MMTEELTPDWPMSLYDEVTTAEQRLTVERMVESGWTLSHIFEYEVGFLGIWMITRPVKTVMSHTPAWVHAYVKADGSTKRYKPPSAIIFNEETENEDR